MIFGSELIFYFCYHRKKIVFIVVCGKPFEKVKLSLTKSCIRIGLDGNFSLNLPGLQ